MADQTTQSNRLTRDMGFRERMAFARSIGQQRAAATNRRIAFSLFLLFVFLSVALVQWSIAGVPVRALYGVALAGLLGLSHQEAFARAVLRHGRTLLLILGFAVVGSLASIIHGDNPAVVGRQLMEIHLQAAVNLVVAAAVLEICGPKSLLKAFLIVIGISALVALGQAVGLGPAWRVRNLFASLGGGSAELGGDGRATGLSLTKVILGTQACLAFAMIYMYRAYTEASRPRRKIDPVIVAAAVAFIFISVAGGNRSPLLGMAMFILLYGTARLGAVALVFGCLLAAVVPFVPDILAQMQGSDVRVLEVGDKSSTGRWPLIVYGWKLFLAHPTGYGFGFDPTLYWSEHWTELSSLPGAVVIQHYPLHNYVLNMLNRYGFGIVFLIPFAVRLIWPHRRVLLGFVPYIGHILFHNDGPLDADFLFWFLVALSSMNVTEPQRSAQPQPTSWRPRRPVAPRVRRPTPLPKVRP